MQKKFTFLTLFEGLVKPYFEDSILKKALEKRLFEVDFINPRAFSADKHKKVDDYQISGGAGLLMSPQPLFDAILHIKSKEKFTHFVFLSPAGKPFRQNDAKRLADEKPHICFVCGRYEGIDERVVETFADEIFSIGDFILTGGELAALALCDSIARNIKGVLGNEASLNDESFENSRLEAPAFTKPFEFECEIPKNFAKNSRNLQEISPKNLQNLKNLQNFSKNSQKFFAIKAFLNGNHSIIADLKSQLALNKTKFFRPDLAAKRTFDEK